MSAIAPSQAELIRVALESRLADVFVSMPGIVKSYDPATRTASITPATKRVILNDADEQVEEEHPQLENVPVCWPAAGGFELHFPLAVGDTGDLLFAMNSFSEWFETGRVSAPGDLRLHSISHAKFYPGLRSAKAAFSTVPAEGEAVLTVGAGVLRVGADSAGLVALAALVSARLDLIQSKFDAHTHLTAGTGSPVPPAGPMLIGPLAAVACTKLKAE